MWEYRGGFGIVLKASDPALSRAVAIKVLAPQLATSGAARSRFAREARAAAAVVHDHVVAIHAVDEANNLPYLVMQYVPGVALSAEIARSGRLPWERAASIGRQVADGIELDIRNEELASEANITIFTASRLLNEWQRKGILTKGRVKILLRAPEALMLSKN